MMVDLEVVRKRLEREVEKEEKEEEEEEDNNIDMIFGGEWEAGSSMGELREEAGELLEGGEGG